MRLVTAAVVGSLALLPAVGCEKSDEQLAAEYEKQHRQDLVTVARYCAYRSVSRAQFNGCTDHVQVGDIMIRAERTRVGQANSNAALYATGIILACRADAAPSCTNGETRAQTAKIMFGGD